jgi:ParB family transcriptional regulator, chromosome partitioning protein
MVAIPIPFITAGTRLRQIDPKQVLALVASISEVGLLNPITVFRRQIVRNGQAVDGYGIVAGSHRLEAMKKLGHDEIEAMVVDLDELHRQLAECDENLCGASLTPAERAMFTARRKEVYEALHPETKHGENQHTRSAQVEQSTAPRFTADTAEKSGRSEQDVRRDVTRAKRIAPDVLQQIQGTEMDTGANLDRLAKLSEPEQRKAVAASVGATPTKKRTVVIAPEPHNDDEATEAQVKRLMGAWNGAGPEAREEFLRRIDRPVMDARYA